MSTRTATLRTLCHIRKEEGPLRVPSVGGAPGFPSCSVIVCTCNRPAALDACLRSVASQKYPRFEILVVDNGHHDPNIHRIAKQHGARYLVEPIQGLSRARNAGALASINEIVAYIDDDAIAYAGWLSNLAQEFADPMVMAVGGRVISTGMNAETESALAAHGFLRSHPCARAVIDLSRPDWFEMTNFGGVGTGNNMAFRRRAFDIWSGFDARLGRGARLEGGEEDYAFFSLVNAGYRVIHAPNAVVRHPAPATLDELRRWRLRNITTVASYATMLLFEARAHRGKIVRYAIEGLRGKRRSWRESAGGGALTGVPLWQCALALFRGSLLYVSTRIWPPKTASRQTADR
jgi:O-antigen biosynthesis protein